jgi:hypothetical protein
MRGVSEESRQLLLVLDLWHHEIEVASEARVANVRGWFDLGGPPEPEEAVFVAGSAMVVHTISSLDGHMQFPRPLFFGPSAPVQYRNKPPGAPETEAFPRRSSIVFSLVLFYRRLSVVFTEYSLYLLPHHGRPSILYV